MAEVATIAVALGGLGLWCSVPDTAELADRNPTTTAFIDLRREEAADAGKPFKLQWQWRSLESISRYLRAAVVAAEDYNFYRHDGVDWHAIEHAAETNWERGSFAIGGSTITQQLAKNLYLSPRRSVFRKLREILIAFSLEDHLGKQRILELYLNVVEWGDGVFGAEAAARFWFHHSAQALSASEAVRLAIALPNPIARAPSVRDPDLTRKAVRLVRVLRMQGMVNAAQERAALDEVGAPGERVLPDRTPPAAASPAASSEREPADDRPRRPPAEPSPESTAPPAPASEEAPAPSPPPAEPSSPSPPAPPSEPAPPPAPTSEPKPGP
ncbi:MAG TPA: monofunctional biosynthetic peptidoglycan transglycosylase [Kofleriaceae bacterium]